MKLVKGKIARLYWIAIGAALALAPTLIALAEGGGDSS
jgi:hypothetical protein